MIEEIRLPEWNYNVEAGLPNEIRGSQPGRLALVESARFSLPSSKGHLISETFGIAKAMPGYESHLHRGRLANRNDVVGDARTFTGNDEPHRNVFRFVVMAAMQQVHDSNSRAKA
jgi:hypothetical protein